MLHRLFPLLLLFIPASLFPAGAFSQPANLAVLDTLAHCTTREICAGLRDKPHGKLMLSIAHHPASWLVEQAYYACSTGESFVPQQAAAGVSDISTLQLYIYSAGVRYMPHPESGDSLIRLAELSIGGKLTSMANSSEIPLAAKSCSMQDTIARSSLVQLENSPYEFTRSVVPDRPADLWKELAEPIIYVSAAALTILLFFTVRSR